MHRVLVVEDDPSVSRLVSLVLRSEGYEVTTAADGLEGLRQVERETPEVVVLDLSLPGIDGRTLIKIARSKGLNPRLLIMSAYGATRAAKELGADGAVEKPFDPEFLLQEVNRLALA